MLRGGYPDQQGPILTAPSGRRFYRHKSGMGSVMLFNDGQPQRVLVLDAAYRSAVCLAFGVYGTDSSLPNYDVCPGTNREFIYLNVADKNVETDTKRAFNVTDEWINANVVKDANTSKYNCAAWLKCGSAPGVEYCRSISVFGNACDLPNIQTLARIYCDSEMLDSMDVTVSGNLERALGSRNSQGAWRIGSGGNNYHAWSSTEYNGYIC